jgi:hypothetical protein
MVTNRLADDVQIRVERGYKLSDPTYDIEQVSVDYAWIQITRPIRECGEICGVPTESEYDECCYEVQVSEDGVNWKGADLDIEELTPNTVYQVRVRTVDLPHHRCASGNWVTKTFTTLLAGAIQITATSPIPLYFTAGGDAPKLIPHTVSARILGETSMLLKGTTDADILEYYHVDFLEEKVYKSVRGGYDITATWDLGQGTVHFELKPVAQTVNITAASSIPLYYSDDSKGPQLIPCSSSVVWDQNNQICDARYTEEGCWDGTHVISSITFTRGTGIETKDLSEGSMWDNRYTGAVTANHYNNSLHIDLISYPPIEPQLTVDIPASIAAGGIPSTILTLNDAPFTFIVRNDTNRQAAIAVFLSFKGVGSGVEYPRDISGMETKPDGGQGPPGSEAYVWDNGYVSPTLLYVDPNSSGSYTLKVWLPEEAVPTGQEFANYTIHTVLKKY